MKTFTVKQQRAVVRSLCRHWWPAFRPSVAKALMLAGRYFTDLKLRAVVRALVIAGGDLETVKADFRSSPEPWHKGFFKWAEKVKGGAL